MHACGLVWTIFLASRTGRGPPAVALLAWGEKESAATKWVGAIGQDRVEIVSVPSGGELGPGLGVGFQDILI